MKAAVLEHYGAPEEFVIKELPIPEIEEGEILIQNKASSVNPVDTLVRQGKTKIITGLIGDQLIGADFAGVVIESKSRRFKAGDEVFGLNNAVKGGSYAEVITAAENATALKPANLTFIEAASLPLVGLTAWQGLVTAGQIEQGDRVLILGCTGGVGTAAVQIAKTFGAVITGTCSTEHVDFAKELGVDHIIDYRNGDISKDLKFDLIFDASGNFTISDLKENLTEKAMFVSTRGGTSDLKGIAEAAMDMVFQKRMKIIKLKEDAGDLDKLCELAESGKLKPYVMQVFPLAEIAEAHKALEAGNTTGKIVIQL